MDETLAEKKDAVISKIIGANNRQTCYVYSKFERDENILFTHINLHTLLSLLSQDASYRNRSENFGTILDNYRNKELYVECYGDFQKFLSSKFNAGLLTANKVFVKTNYALEDEFKDLISNFHYDIETAEFSSKESTAESLNSWFQDQTNHVIGNTISSDILNNEVRLALLNAIHFRGNWSIPFILETNPMIFHVNEKESIHTQMMKIKGQISCQIKEDLPVKIIELDFNSSDLSLVIAIPSEGYTSEDIFLNRYLIEDLKALNKEEVEVYLPTFKIEKLLDCRNKVSDLWLAEEFHDNVNIFDMIDGEEFLKYAEINQKSFINVDKEGIEVASGLGMTFVPTEVDGKATSDNTLKVTEWNMKTIISHRFATTLVTCKMQNNSEVPKEATFTTTIPETAFITDFLMEINDKSYKSYIKAKEKEIRIYKGNIYEDISGETLERTEGIFETYTKGSIKFVSSINLEPQSTAVFFLTYEEMLQRTHNQYELVLNISPGQIVDNLNVEVNIEENQPLKFVKTPPIRSGKQTDSKLEKYLKPPCNIKTINPNISFINFNPDTTYQQKVSCYLGTPISGGLDGQFVVQYDLERDFSKGEILLQDGFFVHFFAVNDLDVLPKHVIFVLHTGYNTDASIFQLKDAMMNILSEIKKGDLISIVEYNDDVIVWDIRNEKPMRITSDVLTDFEDPFRILSKLSLPSAAPADDLTKSKAKRIVQNFYPWGENFIIGGLETGLYIARMNKEKTNENNLKYQPIMVFLTYSKPTIGVKSSFRIVQLVTQLNLDNDKVPIFFLSCCNVQRKAFWRYFSLKNFGFCKQIHGLDHSTQLQCFYKQISSPLLTEIKFEYDADISEVTRFQFPVYFSGGELVVAGRCRGTGCDLPSTINFYRSNSNVQLGSIIKNPVSSLERIWACMTMRQLLEENITFNNTEESTKTAIDFALKYSFVSEVTPMVIVKPGEIFVDTEETPVNHDVSDGGFIRRGIKKRIIKKNENKEAEVKEKIKPIQFIADQPFLIAVTLKRGGQRVFIFMGWVYKPCG